MAADKRGKVWLGAAGLIINKQGKWLVVKKSYGGLKGKWSIPAGFVNEGETADEAAVREVKEETGIDCVSKGLIGLRTGVINTEISDNLLLFLMEAKDGGALSLQESEIVEAAYMSPEELLMDKEASILIHYLLSLANLQNLPPKEDLNPGNVFGYTSYKLFF